MNPELEAKLRLSGNFPSPPGVATHIIELAQDPAIELGKVAKAVSLDSALTTKILRIANSPLYAQRRKSENLRQALVVLGLNATLTLALSFSLVKSLRSGKPHGLDFPFYWRRVMLAATAARALGDALRQPHAEEFFLAGLLQDVGMLALNLAVPDLYGESKDQQRNQALLVEFERKRLQTDHAEVGAWAMRRWNLPARICNAIARSHTADLHAAAQPADILDRSIALSGAIAELFLLEPERRPFAEIGLLVERSFGLDKTAFGQILATIGAIIPETEAMFDAEVLSSHSAEMILDQARDVLMIRSLHTLREINTLKVAAEHSSSRAQELEEESRRDALTGVYNRAYLDQYLAREFEGATRNRWPLSLAFADLDNFKCVNDSFGHQAGDRILEATARILRANTRESDVIARYGGEEFLVVFPATDAQTAHSVCERIVAAFETARHDVGKTHTKVTISIGCATHADHSDFANVGDLVNAADQALYIAKLRGRSRSVPYVPGLQKHLARAI